MRRIDLTAELDEARWTEALERRKMSAFGHLGTHLDAMNKEFPLEYFVLRGRIIDVSNVRGRDVDVADVAHTEIAEGDFILFYSGFLNVAGYGSDEYAKSHPQLSRSLIGLLVERKVSLIGTDAPGVRRGAEHALTDQYCADNGVFIVENVANLDIAASVAGGRAVTVYTFPMRLKGASGLPCRIIAEIDLQNG